MHFKISLVPYGQFTLRVKHLFAVEMNKLGNSMTLTFFESMEEYNISHLSITTFRANRFNIIFFEVGPHPFLKRKDD